METKKSFFRTCRSFMASLCVFVLLSQSVLAVTFTVDDNGDDSDSNAGDGVCATAGAVCTFRAAVEETNALGDEHTINFNAGIESTLMSDVTITGNDITVDGGGTSGITGNSKTQSLMISGDNTTITGMDIDNMFVGVYVNASADGTIISDNVIGEAVSGVENGNSYGVGNFGTNLTILDNTIKNSGNDGVFIDEGSDISITGNAITDSDSSAINIEDGFDISIDNNNLTNNSAYGINVSGSVNLKGGNGGVEGLNIGTTTGNIISGNGQTGIEVSGDDVDGTITIQRNTIGLDDANGMYGIEIGAGAEDLGVFIGTDGDGVDDENEGNVISSNTGDGVAIRSGEIIMKGNKIGTGADGTGDKGNGEEGVDFVGASISSVTIGGSTDAERNIIGNNTGIGVSLNIGSADATLENNYIGVESDGETAAGNGSSAITVLGAGTVTFTDNVIANSNNNGINITGGETINMTGNKVGVTATEVAAGNALTNIYINSPTTTSATIGGAGVGNVIGASTTGFGIHIADMAAASSVVRIWGNYIGVATDGTDIGNNGGGVLLQDGTSYVGTTAAGTGNYISGNDGGGVAVRGSESIFVYVLNSIIGLNPAATAAVANAGSGVVIENENATVYVGRAVEGGKNVISGNTESGIEINAVSTASVVGNYIGTDGTGSSAIGNGSAASIATLLDSGGILVSGGSSVNIGGDIGNENSRNIISGNYGFGIASLVGNVNIKGNYIGLAADGVTALGNVEGDNTLDDFNGSGVLIADVLLEAGAGAVGNINIGGDNAAYRNVIAGNEGSGISLFHYPGGDIDEAEEIDVGPGQDWSAGGIKNNYIGVAADGLTSVLNSDYGMYIDSSETSLITNLNIGSASAKNTVNNTSHVGLYVLDVDLDNESNVSSHNTWTDTECEVTFDWFRKLTAGVLDVSYPASSYCTPVVVEQGSPLPSLTRGTSGSSSRETTRETTTRETVTRETESVSSASEEASEAGVTTAVESEDGGGAGGEDVGAVETEGRLIEEVVEFVEESQKRETKTPSGSVNRQRFVNTPVLSDVEIAVRDHKVKEQISEFVREPVKEIREEQKIRKVYVEKVEKVGKTRELFDQILAPAVIKEVKIFDEQAEQVDKVDVAALVTEFEGVVETSVKNAIVSSGVSAPKIVEAPEDKDVTENIGEVVKSSGGGAPLPLYYRSSNDAEPKQITKDTKIITSFSLEESELLKELYEDEDVVVVDTKTDLDNNGVSDMVEIMNGVFGEEDPDDDGIDFNDEVYFGLDPLLYDEIPDKPYVANMRNVELGKGEYSFRLVGKKHDEVTIIAVNTVTGEKTLLATTTLDQANKGEITYDTSELPQGDYYIMVKGFNGIGEVGEIKITEDDALDAPEISMRGGYVWVSLASADFNSEKKEDGTMKLSGDTVPGSMVYITWKSVHYGSVVLADANGKFEMDVPVEGEHEVLVYALNPEENIFTSVSKLLFFN